MKQILYIIFIYLIQHSLQAQHNFLGKTQDEIITYFNQNPDYSIKKDTVKPNSIILTFRPIYQYPFYTYELDMTNDSCISYALVSKNEEVLNAYLDLLNIVGETKDDNNTNLDNITYRVRSGNLLYYYSITQPYFNSDVASRRKLFYIMVTYDIIH